MAAGTAAKTMRAPGRLVVNPTQAFDGGTYPYGGTEVGRVTQCRVVPLGTAMNVWYESLGEIGDVLESDNRVVFGCFLRGWDDEAVRCFLADGYEKGLVTQHAVYNIPGTKTPGESALDRAVRLAFVPDDLIGSDGVMLYRAVPNWSDGAEVAFERREELGIPLTFECLRDDQGNTLRVGRLPDLALI